MHKYISEIISILKSKEQEIIDNYHSGESWINKLSLVLFEILTKIGHQHKFHVNCNMHTVVKADESEWLYDLVWSKVKLNGRMTLTTKVVLVVESEISNINFGGLKRDFDKLLIAANSLKLFICRLTNKNQVDYKDFIDYVIRQVLNNEDIKMDDGIYLITWNEIGERPKFEINFIKKQAT